MILPDPTVENPILTCDLLEYLLATPRSYRSCMSVWRTTCPRLSIYEDAMDAGLIAIERSRRECLVVATEDGRRFLHNRRPEQRRSS